MDIARK